MTSKINNEIKLLIDKYVSQLDEKEKQALNIAINHLESSFTIEKSIGFLKFLEKNNIDL